MPQPLTPGRRKPGGTTWRRATQWDVLIDHRPLSRLRVRTASLELRLPGDDELAELPGVAAEGVHEADRLRSVMLLRLDQLRARLVDVGYDRLKSFERTRHHVRHALAYDDVPRKEPTIAGSGRHGVPVVSGVRPDQAYPFEEQPQLGPNSRARPRGDNVCVTRPARLSGPERD